MKTTIKIIGFIALFFIALGTLFKLMFWPGATLSLLIGNLSFTLIFIPLFFIQRFISSETTIEKTTNIIGFISLLFVFLGSIFKVQHWPGANLLLLIGTLIFIFLALPLYIFVVQKKTEKKFSEMTSVIFIGVYLSLFLILYTQNYSRSILTNFVTLGEDKKTTLNMIEEIIHDYDLKLNSLDNNSQDIKVISNQSNELTAFIHEVKTNLISFIDGPNDIELKLKDNSLVFQKDSYYGVTYIMLGGKGSELKDKLSKYRSTITDYLNKSEGTLLEIEIEKLLYTGEFTQYGREISWEEEMFYYVPLSGALAILNGIENDIKVAELQLKRFKFQKMKNKKELTSELVIDHNND